MKVLVTGATGYVASRLLPALIQEGFEVRATSRHPESIAQLHPEIETTPSDMNDPASLEEALSGIDIAYYLVHSMAGENFRHKDRQAAHNFLRAAETAGVRRIVYLGGLGEPGDELSTHLQSRHEVGEILASGKIETIELRAAIIVGAGSAAFEMLRHLTDRLPAMIAPRWLETKIQPIAERDLVEYLVAAASVAITGNRIVQIGGRDVVTYREMIRGYARSRGLRRLIVGVPVLSPRLSSYWVSLVTPIKASIAQPLIDGLRNEVIVTDDSMKQLFPDVRPTGYAEAVEAALKHQVDVLDTYSEPGSPLEPGALAGILTERRSVATEVPVEKLWAHVGAVGGDPRWYPLRWAWWVRARLDDLFGGAGLRWHRPDGPLEPGDEVDWWTVEDARTGRLLLRARMKTPGEAWLEWRAVPRDHGSELRQVAYFRPKGLLGYLYWWGLYPFHAPIFMLMAKRIAEKAAG